MAKKSLLDPPFVTALINAMKLVFPTREEMEKFFEEKFNEKLKFLPTKTHFDKRMDELTHEVQAMRDEQTLHQGQHDEINDRFERVDKHIGVSTV